MFTEACLNRLARRDWLLNVPLNQFIDSYIAELERLSYARGTVERTPGASLISVIG
jgi:hypothetical protein